MRWDESHESQDVEDRRGEGGGAGSMGFGGGGFGGMRMGFGGLVVLGILSLVFKIDLISPFLGMGGGAAPVRSSRPAPVNDPAENKLAKFVGFVLDDAQSSWTKLLPEQRGTSYRRAKLVLFRDFVRSGCGDAEGAMGPFYCPADEKVYIDLNFYDELKRKFGAPGDFAQAYVIAHELGHHVQNVTGIEQQVREAQRRNPRAQKQLSVLMELQADCYAGIWAHETGQKGFIEAGDIDEALAAAAAVGDDNIQRKTSGTVRPESFTHGSSAQRKQWFQTGYETGKISACNTFANN